MREIPKDRNEIDPNTKTIEMDGGLGVISEGKYIGLKFIKKKDKIRFLEYDEEFLNQAKENFNKKNEI